MVTLVIIPLLFILHHTFSSLKYGQSKGIISTHCRLPRINSAYLLMWFVLEYNDSLINLSNTENPSSSSLIEDWPEGTQNISSYIYIILLFTYKYNSFRQVLNFVASVIHHTSRYNHSWRQVPKNYESSTCTDSLIGSWPHTFLK